MAYRLEGEISFDLIKKTVKKLPLLNAIHNSDNTILIHGMGGQTRGFYRNLKQKTSIKLLWTDWCGKSWWSYIFSFIPGQTGLIKVLDKKQLDTLYIETGIRSMCGLYFIPNNKVDCILEEVKKKKVNDNLEKILENEKNYFLLIVDFDYFGGEKDGQITYIEIIIGDNLDEEIKQTLKIIE